MQLDETRERGFIPRLSVRTRAPTRGCVGAMRARGVTPHVAQNTSGRSNTIDGYTPGIAATTSVSGCGNESRRCQGRSKSVPLGRRCSTRMSRYGRGEKNRSGRECGVV